MLSICSRSYDIIDFLFYYKEEELKHMVAVRETLNRMIARRFLDPEVRQRRKEVRFFIPNTLLARVVGIHNIRENPSLAASSRRKL